MDAETTRLKDATVALKAEEKELRAALREGTAQVPLPELKASVASLEAEKLTLVARLEKLKSGSIKPITAEERDGLNKEHTKWKKCAHARRKIRLELWAEIRGHIEKGKVEELREELDLHI